MLHCVSYENSAISKNNGTFPLKFVENCGRKKFIKYLTTVSWLSCDNDKVTIDFTKRLAKNARFFLGTIHSQDRKIV